MAKKAGFLAVGGMAAAISTIWYLTTRPTVPPGEYEYLASVSLELLTLDGQPLGPVVTEGESFLARVSVTNWSVMDGTAVDAKLKTYALAHVGIVVDSNSIQTDFSANETIVWDFTFTVPADAAGETIVLVQAWVESAVTGDLLDIAQATLTIESGAIISYGASAVLEVL